MPEINVSADQLTWYRLKRSGLVEPFKSPEATASALGGVQAQILSAAGIALTNRLHGFSKTRLEELLWGERTLVKLWGQRFTLHLYPSAQWPVVHSAYARNRTWWRRSYCKNGGIEEEFDEIVDMFAATLLQKGLDGMCRADQRGLSLVKDPEFLSSWGGLFAELVMQGVACHGRKNGSESYFVHREHWLLELSWNPPKPHVANRQLALQYLHTYGPSPVKDLVYWSGSSLREVQPSIDFLSKKIAHLRYNGRTLLCLSKDLDELLQPPPPRGHWPLLMLGRFDPVLLGHKDKSWICPNPFYKRVWRPAGHIEATIIHLGKTIATWRYKLNGPGLEITVYPFKKIPQSILPKIRTRAKNIARHFGVRPNKLEIKFEKT